MMSHVGLPKSRKGWIGAAALALVISCGMLLSGSDDAAQAADAAHGAAGGQPPAPNVDVAVMHPENVRMWSQFSGRLAAVDRVEVRPLVSGTVTDILFQEGANVEKGDPLYVIDPRPFEAEVATAQAAMESAQAQVNLAQVELKRAKELVEKKIISESKHDSAQSDYKVAFAALNAAKARLQQAKLNLEYAHIKAPVSGRIGRAEITIGNVVQAGQNAPVLTTIVSNDKLYAEFDVDEQTYIRMARNKDSSAMPVEVTLTGNDDVTYHGVMHSFDNQLDTRSGTIRARAILDNEDKALVPGMYANVRLGSADERMALMVPEKAIGTDQNKKFVYVITPENKVSYREVTLGSAVAGKRQVVSGLQDGEMVLVNGLQRVRPEMVVNPVVAEAAADKTADAGTPDAETLAKP